MHMWCVWLSRSLRCSAAGLSLVLLLVGCGSTSSAPPFPTAPITPTLSEVRSVSTGVSRTYLGAVNGTQALLGIVLSGTQMRAYVCDGTSSRLATLAEWFVSRVKGGQVQTSSQDQQIQLTAQFAAQSASGTLRLAAGRTYSFSIQRMSATAQVGVFEGTALIGEQRYHAGWLRLSDGEQRGAATYYPSSPIRGQIVIALLPAFPTDSI